MTKLTLLFLLAIICYSPNSVFATPIENPSAEASVNVLPMVYLNKANIDQLASLKGIGRKKAQAIISYRELNGKFVSTDDLLKVKGIGVKIIADNEQRLKI